MVSGLSSRAGLIIRRAVRVTLLDDPALKLVCLALALGLWFYIDGEIMETKTVEMQMRPGDILRSDNLEIDQPDNLPRFVVRVRGARKQLDLWQPQSLRFRRPLLSNPHEGVNWVSAAPDDIEAQTFAILSVAPAEAGTNSVTLNKVVSEMRPVRVRTRGKQRDGFLVGSPSIWPPTVKVSGCEDALTALNEVWTEDMQIDGADVDLTTDLGIAPRIEVNGKAVTLHCDQRVHVTLPITPIIVTHAFTLDVWARVPPGRVLRVEPATVQVELVVEERDFKEKDILAQVSLYVEWPAQWAQPAEGVPLGPMPVRVKFIAPPRVSVRGVNNTPLPTVNVTGALVGGLK
jgi:hypothetical protein